LIKLSHSWNIFTIFPLLKNTYVISSTCQIHRVLLFIRQKLTSSFSEILYYAWILCKSQLASKNGFGSHHLQVISRSGLFLDLSLTMMKFHNFFQSVHYCTFDAPFECSKIRVRTILLQAANCKYSLYLHFRRIHTPTSCCIYSHRHIFQMNILDRGNDSQDIQHLNSHINHSVWIIIVHGHHIIGSFWCWK
jgi:hypothetical protein